MTMDPTQLVEKPDLEKDNEFELDAGPVPHSGEAISNEVWHTPRVSYKFASDSLQIIETGTQSGALVRHETCIFHRKTS